MSDVYAPPKNLDHSTHGPSSASLKQSLRGRYQLGVLAAFSEGWQLTHGMKWRTHLALLAYSLLPMALVMVFGVIVTVWVAKDGSDQLMSLLLDQGESQLWLQLAGDAYGLISSAVFTPMVVGLGMIGLKRALGVNFFVFESYRYFQFFRPLFVVGFINGVVSFCIFSLPVNYQHFFFVLSLPCIYLLIAFIFAGPLVVEKNLSALQALKLSYGVTRHRWFKFFGFYLLMIFWNLIGLIPLGIGLFWTIPMTLTAYGIVYRDVFGVEADNPLFNGR